MDKLQAMTPLDLKPELNLQSFEALINPLRRHEVSMVNFEAVHRRKDGSFYPVEVHLQLFDDEDERYFHSIIMNITERMAAEQQVKLAAEVFEYSIDGILITDADNRIISANQSYTVITGYTEAELKGKNPSIASSGLHEASFFKDIRQAINNTGAGKVSYGTVGRTVSFIPHGSILASSKTPRTRYATISVFCLILSSAKRQK
ncbi:MAG: PAS domain-containing protein [Methylococcales bacterium]|nr:PAS domain-containing protein [Methylococcales bacterium]